MELTRAIVLVATLAACGRGATATTPGRVAASDADVELYRDATVVRTTASVEVGPRGGTVSVRLPDDVDAEDLLVVPRGDATVGRLGVADHVATAELTAGKPGRYSVELVYATTAISWSVAYTMTTDPARRFAQLRGAVAVTNASTIDLPRARIVIVDGDLAAARLAQQRRLTSHLYGSTSADGPRPREIATAALPRGETRLELLTGDRPRPMRSVLVFDPLGTAFDHEAEHATTDPELGQRTPTRVHESFEIARPRHASGDLPTGPVRLLGRRTDGSLAVLGEAELDSSSKDTPFDTIAVGTADGVRAKRTRVELTVDEHAPRLVEEVAIELVNSRPVPVEVIIREHAYRGTIWSVAYSSQRAEQAGSRAFAMRVTVPARGRARTTHTIVYTWARDASSSN